MTEIIWVSHEQAQAIRQRNQQVQAWLATRPLPSAEVSLKLIDQVRTDPRLQLTNKAWELEQERQRKRQRMQARQQSHDYGPSL